MYDAIIIGAGVVGAMCARSFTMQGMKVCITEKESDVAMGATKANSAIVHAGFDATEGRLKAKLNVKGSQMMEDICLKLGVKYQNNGSVVVGFNEEDLNHIKELKKRGDANGVKGLEVLMGEEVFKKEPGLSKNVTSALWAPTGAIVCPYDLTVAAIGNAMDNGADLKTNFHVKSICEKDGVYTVSNGEESIQANIVINAAGIYSDYVASLIGDCSFTVHPRKGEYILLDKPKKLPVKATVFRTPTKMGKGILVTPTVDGNVLLGPTSVDMEDKDDTSTQSEGFKKILSQATENVDGLSLNKSITSFCGLRAAGSTGDFIITSPRKGFINLGGIESPGLSASPAIAEYVLEMLTGQGFKFEPKKDFNPIRKSMHFFREMNIDEKNSVIKKDPAYGKIVCRCEGVTEGEILYAIRQNPRPTDLDGIKRRTRAQMGRCQGGFCMPYVAELLSKETGVSMENITKSGKNSRIITGFAKEGLK